MRRRCEWAAGLVLLLLPVVAACGRPLTHARELASIVHPPPDAPTPTPTWTAASLSTPTPPSQIPTMAPLPTGVSQPAPVSALALLPTIISQPAPAPTPFPDAQEVVDAVLGTGTSEHWTSYLVSGSVTARGADERLALVGNIGDHNEVRWVVVGQTDEGWCLRGTSECLGSGLDVPPSFDLPPDLIDFDDDDRQEVLSYYSQMQGGRMVSAEALYRWDGHALAAVWEVPTLAGDALAGGQTVPQPLPADYRAEWEWVDLDGRGLDEILLHEHVTFYQPDEEGAIGEHAQPIAEERAERAFRWDGEAFRPYAPHGPGATFAYVASGDVWLWQDHTARPLGAERAEGIRWSPDGRRIAWWARSPLEIDSPSGVLGVYDLRTGERREFSLEAGPLALHWAPDGRLAYALPDRPPALLDPETGQQAPLAVPSLGTWSPDGNRGAYERDGSLFVYDGSTCQERPLVVAPTEGGSVDLAVLPDLAWSPQGDWIACYLSNHDFTWVGLIPPDLSDPVSALDLLATFGGRRATGLQFAWAPDGGHLAALATDPRFGQQPTILYLAEVPRRSSGPMARLEWRKTLELETVTHTVGLAWAPGGERVMLAAGAEVWEVAAAGEATLRRRFSFPDLQWKTLEWAPDGSGVLVGLESGGQGRLYWFAADGAEPILLLAGSVGIARWAPRTGEARGCLQEQPPMVLVEYAGYKPRLHFVDEDGSDTVVRADRAIRGTPFRVGGERVYYYTYYADGRRVRTLRVPRGLADCQPPLVSPDGRRLAWLCDGGPPGMGALMDGTAEVHSRLIVTDWRARDVREVWHHVETGRACRSIRLMGWRGDGEVVYLSRPKYGAAWAYFEYNPGILALDVSTGQVTRIGDPDGVHDAVVSPDGAWLAQSTVDEWPRQGVTVTLRSLVGGMERAVACAPGAIAAGDFSFSPHNGWLAWRERVAAPGGSNLLIRALRLPDGDPLTVYEDAEDVAPRIGGWLRRDDLVLVHPVREDGTGEHSALVTLPATGPGVSFSPFVFLGVVGDDPCWGGTRSTASSPRGALEHPAGAPKPVENGFPAGVSGCSAISPP